IFFLTARTGLGQSLFSQLKNKELKASYFDWPYKKYHDNKYSKKALKEINNCSPDILFLGLGASWQEIWAIRNKSKLKAKLVIAVGSALDYVSGQKKRAPLWMQKNGLEWFWRFLIEPKRLFKRFFIEDFPLALKLIAKG
ncbi:glycosyltransferase, partial [Candidatus Beckwithbacteria bacterium CG10_big_fil_rev_8_21_14_0_10_34_10]